MGGVQTLSRYEQLADYRRRVAEFYAELRRSGLPEPERAAWFRARRDELFGTHPQSALDEADRLAFRGLAYFPYDPAYRLVAPVEPAESGTLVINLPDEGTLRLERFGRARFTLAGQGMSLSLFWVQGYGGGIFLPFGDGTSGRETYGGGRYLLDTIKGADLGQEEGRLVLDFNYAYNPSCAYSRRWVCPLPPAENRLPVPIPAGERSYPRVERM